MSAHDLTKVTLGGVIDDISTAGPNLYSGTKGI